MAKDISHAGKIIGINPRFTTVEIVSHSACSSCHAALLCGVSESKTKVVEVPTVVSPLFELGEEVQVIMKASMGHKAVWIAYLVPLLVFMAFLLGFLAAGFNELSSALVALVGLAAYYAALFLLRDRLRSEYVFKIEKK